MNKYVITVWEGVGNIKEKALFSYGYISKDNEYRDVRFLIKPKSIVVSGDYWDWKDEYDGIGVASFIDHESDVQFEAPDDKSAKLIFEVGQDAL